MSIRSGSNGNLPIYGKNFIHEEAQARLQEVVRPARDQVNNATAVDRYDASIFVPCKSSAICTCKQASLEQFDREEMGTAPNATHSEQTVGGIGNEFEVDWAKPLFGEQAEQTGFDDADIEDFEVETNSFGDDAITSTIDDAVDCGICYRQGYVPSFTQVGATRITLATHNMHDCKDYLINMHELPFTLNKQHKFSYVEYEILVPRFYKKLFYGIKNNHELLNEKLWFQTDKGWQPLTKSDIDANRGRKILIRIHAEKFTHVVVSFDFGTDVFVNCQQLNIVTDWTKFQAIGNISMTLPPHIVSKVEANSLIVIPQRNIVCKVNDLNQLKVSTGSAMDWTVSTRVLQPVESMTQINRLFLLV